MDDQYIQQALMRLSNDISALQAEVKSTWKRIDEQKALAESAHTLALSVRDLTNAQKNNTEAITELRSDVDERQQKPAKRWDGVVGTVLTAIVTAIITYVVAMMGLKR